MTRRARWRACTGLMLAALGAAAGFTPMAVPGAEACERIDFVHVGPEDAALPVLTVSIGAPAASTGAHILVGRAGYAAIQDELRRAPDGPPESSTPFGTFEARTAACAHALATQRIGPATFLSVMRRLRAAFPAGVALPDTALRIETMVRAASPQVR